jgi:hypothetical protein
VSEADKAHAVALFLLPFVRELIGGPTPLHLIEAPTMASGKGLLADAMPLPALGDVPAPMTEATTDEEWGKVITSNLLAAPAVIYIDNLNRTLASSKLAAALTTREFSDRVFSVEIDGTTLRLQVGDGGTSHKTRLWKLAPVDRGVMGVWGLSPYPHAREVNSSDAGLIGNPPNTPNPPAIPPLPAYAQWHNADHDEPVMVVGVLGEQDGVLYPAIEGSQTGIPAHEVEFFAEVADA